MSRLIDDEARAPAFRRNAELDRLLRRLNDLLAGSEHRALEYHADENEDYPVAFVMGPHRSGTTLFMQWLASTNAVAYPTNLLSRFFGAPLIGAMVQLLLTDPRYNFRNEITDFNSAVSFESENGKTSGALAPNEFWYFWRRFLPFTDLDWLPDEELFKVVDQGTLVAELKGLTQVFAKPFALKGMILNYNIPFLDAIFDKALFIQIQRDPVTNVASVLDARKRQLGSEAGWYSFKIPEYPMLKQLEPIAQCAGQVHYINRAVANGMASLKDSRKIVVPYEAFCRNPRRVFGELVEKLGISGRVAGYSGPQHFMPTRESDLPDRAAIESALAEFEERRC